MTTQAIPRFSGIQFVRASKETSGGAQLTLRLDKDDLKLLPFHLHYPKDRYNVTLDRTLGTDQLQLRFAPTLYDNGPESAEVNRTVDAHLMAPLLKKVASKGSLLSRLFRSGGKPPEIPAREFHGLTKQETTAKREAFERFVSRYPNVQGLDYKMYQKSREPFQENLAALAAIAKVKVDN